MSVQVRPKPVEVEGIFDLIALEVVLTTETLNVVVA
jgi:hypothetical protein